LRWKASDIGGSTVLALLLAALVGFLYRIDWPWILGLTLAVDPVILFVLRNQSKNYRKWSKHPTTFPNPAGGGILGEYMMRPWQNELAATREPKPDRSDHTDHELTRRDRISRRKARRKRHLQKLRS
jgi:hypothetical protein